MRQRALLDDMTAELPLQSDAEAPASTAIAPPPDPPAPGDPPPTAEQYWRAARYQLGIARALLEYDGASWTGSAEHILRGWRSLICMRAVSQDRTLLPDEDLGSELSDALPQLLGGQEPSSWRSSFESLTLLAGTDSWFDGRGLQTDSRTARQQRRDIERQTALLNRAVRSTRPGTPARMPWRWPLLILIVVGLIPLGRTLLDGQLSKQDQGQVADIPSSARVALEDLSRIRSDGDPWDLPGNMQFQDSARIDFDRVWRPTQVDLSVDGNDKYHFAFFNGEGVVGIVEVGPADQPAGSGGVSVQRVDVPPGVAEAGTDHVEVTALSGDGAFAVGHFLMVE